MSNNYNFSPSPSCRPQHGFSALHLAAGEGLTACAAALVARWAALNAADNVDGVTPVSVAVSSGHVELAALLLAAGALRRNRAIACINIHLRSAVGERAPGWLLRFTVGVAGQ